MVSNPIEKLIRDLEEERAKEYWERIKRFKAQEEDQKKSREAHEKKQLEYMRSAGIDLKQVEKEQEEDARKLKSYLEQNRPPLISRPKQAPQIQRRYAPAIRFSRLVQDEMMSLASQIDPVGTAPGGNITGLSNRSPDLAGKRLELLREALPRVRRLAIMANVGYPSSLLEIRELQAAARTLGIEVAPLFVGRPTRAIT